MSTTPKSSLSKSPQAEGLGEALPQEINIRVSGRLNEHFQADVISIVGAEAFEIKTTALKEWTRNTLDSPRSLKGVVKPQNQTQVIALVKLCRQHKVPFYPVSTGKNWGYGGATPVTNDVLVIDLSGLKRIVEF